MKNVQKTIPELRVEKIAIEIIAANVEQARVISYLNDAKHTIDRLLKYHFKKYIEVQSLFNMAEMYLDKARTHATKIE